METKEFHMNFQKKHIKYTQKEAHATDASIWVSISLKTKNNIILSGKLFMKLNILKIHRMDTVYRAITDCFYYGFKF